MPDPTPATPPATPPAPPPNGDPAKPAGAAPSLAEVKAARRTKPAAPKVPSVSADAVSTGDAKPPAADPAPKPADPPAPAAKPPETAKIDMDPKALGEFTQLNKDIRELRGKLKDAESKLADFGKIEKAKQLAKEGKHFDAVKEAGFIDIDAALAELLQQNGGQQASPELLALRREVDELKAKHANEDKARTEAQTAAEKAAVENDRKIAGRFVTENAAKYPALAKAPEFVEGAFQDFTKARAKLEAEAGAPLPGDEQAKLMIDALAVHEEKWAKVLGTAPAPAAADPPPANGVDSTVRAGVQQPVVKQPERMTFAQVKAARRAAGRQ